MKDKYLWAIGGLLIGALFGSKIPVLNKVKL